VDKLLKYRWPWNMREREKWGKGPRYPEIGRRCKRGDETVPPYLCSVRGFRRGGRGEGSRIWIALSQCRRCGRWREEVGEACKGCAGEKKGVQQFLPVYRGAKSTRGLLFRMGYLGEVKLETTSDCVEWVGQQK